MATEPFKNRINLHTIVGMADHFARYDAAFCKKAFISRASHDLESLELKQRCQQVTQAMYECLPSGFEDAATVIKLSLGPRLDDAISGGQVDERGIGGWVITALADFVAQYGQASFALSMDLLRELTQRLSAEFAIRFFLDQQQEKTLAQLQKWTEHEDHHVRRLVSEGTRPLLPWGFQLKRFRQNPKPVIPLLEALKDDPSEYVRRSVANHLNDIAKDHPELVADIAQDWLAQASKNRHRLVRHGCRTLLKNDHPRALALFGYDTQAFEVCVLEVPEMVSIGESLMLKLTIKPTLPARKKPQTLMVDYVIHHQKSNGRLTPKVFKWRLLRLNAERVDSQCSNFGQTITLTKKHSFKPVTTRRYYPGEHRIDVKINGQVLASRVFILYDKNMGA